MDSSLPNLLVGLSASFLIYSLLIVHMLPSRRGHFAATDEWILCASRGADASFQDKLAAAEMCCQGLEPA
ncbi:hypothetical protein CDD82_5438 [Ophiocordyceps australis]|uniref:Uncharacterized protein n=1 Tax=Ophiocordyceps australis TaxID=1399860 RepID=A0A2C5ZV09_9HYPO|nr:hypothetical protein CDD82_5438 [Ophiocordyceps australis]